MRVSKVLNTNVTNKEQSLKNVTSNVLSKTPTALKDTFVAAKVRLTQATNSDYMKIIRGWFGC